LQRNGYNPRADSTVRGTGTRQRGDVLGSSGRQAQGNRLSCRLRRNCLPGAKL